MRVSKERQEARVRISQLEYRFEMAMEEGDEYLEIEIALLNVLNRIKNRELIELYPNPKE
jgi:hypothetical protein